MISKIIILRRNFNCCSCYVEHYIVSSNNYKSLHFTSVHERFKEPIVSFRAVDKVVQRVEFCRGTRSTLYIIATISTKLAAFSLYLISKKVENFSGSSSYLTSARKTFIRILSLIDTCLKCPLLKSLANMLKFDRTNPTSTIYSVLA